MKKWLCFLSLLVLLLSACVDATGVDASVGFVFIEDLSSQSDGLIVKTGGCEPKVKASLFGFERLKGGGLKFSTDEVVCIGFAPRARVWVKSGDTIASYSSVDVSVGLLVSSFNIYAVFQDSGLGYPLVQMPVSGNRISRISKYVLFPVSRLDTSTEFGTLSILGFRCEKTNEVFFVKFDEIEISGVKVVEHPELRITCRQARPN